MSELLFKVILHLIFSSHVLYLKKFLSVFSQGVKIGHPEQTGKHSCRQVCTAMCYLEVPQLVRGEVVFLSHFYVVTYYNYVHHNYIENRIQS